MRSDVAAEESVQLPLAPPMLLFELTCFECVIGVLELGALGGLCGQGSVQLGLESPMLCFLEA
jgi:hypothetical protein